MTAVQPLPNLHSLPGLGWESAGSGGDSDFGQEEVNRLGGGRKRSNSDTKPTTLSSSPVKREDVPTSRESEGTSSVLPRGFWPVPQITSSRLTKALARTPLEPVSSNIGSSASAAPKNMQNPSHPLTNGTRMGPQPPAQETPALLVLLPMNATFERKQINVPLFPEMLRIGRQTNAKTVPTPTNGYFDSKVLSRQHAEVWADRSGKVWIRDVKSSNGTFVNGVRLSPESRDSEPHELRENDMLELGIDIVSEDQKSIVHHKVSAKVEHAGVPTNATSVLDLNMADIEPGSGGGLSLVNGSIPRRLSNSSVSSTGRSGVFSVNGAQANGYGLQRHMGAWNSHVHIDQVVKCLMTEMRNAKQQSQDLGRTDDFFHALLHVEPGQDVPKVPTELFQAPPVMNGIIPHKEHISPFSQPPAPPPQQPLPEKPDVPPSSSPDGHIIASLRRNETEKVFTNGSKHESHSSQILQLVEALTAAKKQLDNQDNRVQELEEELRRERRARQHAEEVMQSLSHPKLLNASVTNHDDDAESIISQDTIMEDKSDSASDHEDAALSAARLQERLDTMLHEMQDLKEQLNHYKLRAETAEQDRSSLADMVEQIRSKDAANSPISSPKRFKNNEDKTGLWSQTNGSATSHHESENHEKGMNGSADKSALHKKQLENLASAAMSLRRDDRLMQSAPYASIVGVVLIGVGIMTYLNGWQKLEAT